MTVKPVEEIPFSGDLGPPSVMRDGRMVSCHAEEDSRESLDEERPERWVLIRFSSDSGKTWTEPEKAFAFPAGKGSPGAGLSLVDRDDNIHVFGIRYYGFGKDGQPWLCTLQHNRSSDGGKTWRGLVDIDFGHPYTGALNCVLQMDSGRIVLPLSYLDEESQNGKFVCVTVYSDDGGDTWGRSGDIRVNYGDAFLESGAIEPVAVQLPGGLVWMLIRTTIGYFWESFSNDGAIWTPPITTRIVASNSPGGLVRLSDDRIVMIWNNLWGEPFRQGISYARQKLHAAISSDGAQTWSPPKVVAERRADEPLLTSLCYPMPCQAPDGSVLFTYGRVWRTPEGRGHSVHLVRLDPDWLAEATARPPRAAGSAGR